MTTPPGEGPPGPDRYPPPRPPGYGYPLPDHPQATTALTLGIVGLVVCQVVSPVAWWIGRRTVAEIDASQGRLGGRTQAQTGFILGLVGTVILGIGALVLAVYLLVVLVVVGGSVLRM